MNVLLKRIDLFTYTAGHIEIIRFKKYYRMPRGRSTIRYTRSVFTRAFRANFSLSFPRNNDRLFPEK